MATYLSPPRTSVYLGRTVDPEVSQTATPITLSNSVHNLGLVQVSGSSTGVAVNVTNAPVGATHAWFALFSTAGNLVAATADALAVQWGTGMQSFNWTTPVNLSGLYYVDIVNNAGTAPKLSGVNLPAEANFNAVFPRWAQNSTAFPAGGGPPVPGNTIAPYSLTGTYTAQTAGFFAGLF